MTRKKLSKPTDTLLEAAHADLLVERLIRALFSVGKSCPDAECDRVSPGAPETVLPLA
jgi:hypothetical protein